MFQGFFVLDHYIHLLQHQKSIPWHGESWRYPNNFLSQEPLPQFPTFHDYIPYLPLSCSLLPKKKADAAVARNSLQAISVLILQHVAETMDGDDGLSCHLAVKPDLFAGILRALMQVSAWCAVVWYHLFIWGISLIGVVVAILLELQWALLRSLRGQVFALQHFARLCRVITICGGAPE